ncbi:MAG TPA: peptidoglycan-binding domain-containing protein [Dongiaceae bacterium]|nr:peptidoglycan-binding domain-containing protein [Dongiaceae bacterium]
MAEEDKGAGSDKTKRPEEALPGRPQPVTPPAAAPGWVVPPNLRRAPVIPAATPAPPPQRSPTAAPPPPPAGSPPPAAASAPPPPAGKAETEPHLEDRAEPPVLDEKTLAEEAHEPKLGPVPAAPKPDGPAAPDAQKPKRWGRISPPLMARANERVVGEEDNPRRRGGWVAVLVLLLLVGGGVWLWRQGRLEPILAPVRTLIAKVMPGAAPSSTPAPASAPAAAAPATTATNSASTGASSTGAATAQPASDNAAMIQEIKQLLAKLDMGPGPIDGTLDPTTVDAIRSYQQMAGMPVDGQPSQELLQDLRAVVADQRPAGG